MLLNRETNSLPTIRCTRKGTALARRAHLSQFNATSQSTLWAALRRQAVTCTTHTTKHRGRLLLTGR